MERYEKEAPAPAEPTLREGVRYLFDEIQRRAYNSTKGLTKEQVDHEPGEGSWGIGSILAHQLRLVAFMTNTLSPGAIAQAVPAEAGEAGNWSMDVLLARREELNERFRQIWSAVGDDTLMGLRPGLPPEAWAEWPVLMRLLRPLTDLATHVGQVNYIRRRLGNPVGKY
jgi:hypothetical protein